MSRGEDSLKLGRGAGAAPGGVGTAGGRAGEKGSEILEKDSELHQREFALLVAQQTLDEVRRCADGTEATLRSKRDVFEEAMECLNDDLGRTQIALDEAEAHEQEAVVECQRALKVFKFKKYKEAYEDEKHEVSLKYSLDIGSFLRGEGQDPPEGSATRTVGWRPLINLHLGM